MNPLLDYVDNSFDAQVALAMSRIDRIRIARLQTVRTLVWSRLHELGHDFETADAPWRPLSSTTCNSVHVAPAAGSVFPLDAFAVNPEDLSQYLFEPISVPAGPDLRVVNARKTLRRLLRLLNKVISIALRREAFHNPLRQLVLRLRAFFVIHGDHPPRHLFRHLLTPGGGAV